MSWITEFSYFLLFGLQIIKHFLFAEWHNAVGFIWIWFFIILYFLTTAYEALSEVYMTMDERNWIKFFVSHFWKPVTFLRRNKKHSQVIWEGQKLHLRTNPLQMSSGFVKESPNTTNLFAALYRNLIAWQLAREIQNQTSFFHVLNILENPNFISTRVFWGINQIFLGILPKIAYSFNRITVDVDIKIPLKNKRIFSVSELFHQTRNL